MSNLDSIPLPTHSRFKNLIGKTFGHLSVLGFAGNDQRGKHPKWQVSCLLCGSVRVVQGDTLVAGKAVCRCKNSDSILNRDRRLVHGRADSPEHGVWRAMWQRCTNPNNPYYQKYRDRVPPEVWKDFAVFYAELGPRPTPKHSLDRIDNSKPYGPGNCRWATKEEQNGNTRRNIYVHLGGQRLWLAEACRRLGYKSPEYRAIVDGIRQGQTVEQASGGLLTSA